MKKIIFLTIFFLVFSLSPLTMCLHADEVDLVKMKKEAEEKKKQSEKSKKKAKVITNETLKKYDKYKSNIGSKPGDKKSSDAVKPEKPKKTDPKETREYWQKLKNNLEKQIKEYKEKIERDQLKLNMLITQLLRMGIERERRRLQTEVDKFRASLKWDKNTLANIKAEYDSLPEKARKAGVPPGWAR